ncbi:MAG: metallophosphoesterase [Sedimentisphaerales bacterium]|nr:metallophosphoesterase [Sedimentisphaerales bacterium]
MKIGILSDTHDHQEHVLTAINIFNEFDLDYVLHAGDFVSPFTVRTFDQLKSAKLIAVFGNNEGKRQTIREIFADLGGEIFDTDYRGTLNGKKIYMIHTPHYIREIVDSNQYDLVIYGHTHRQDIYRQENTLVINPGECSDWVTGSSHIVILNLDNMNYESIPLN